MVLLQSTSAFGSPVQEAGWLQKLDEPELENILCGENTSHFRRTLSQLRMLI